MIKLLPRIAHFIVEYRRVSILLVFCVLAFAFGTIARFGLKTDFTPQALFTTADEQAEIEAEFSRLFGSTENVLMVLVEGQDVTTAAGVQYLHDLSLALRDEPFAERVDSLTLTPIPRTGAEGELIVSPSIRDAVVTPEQHADLLAALASSPLLDGQLVSESRHMAIVAVRMSPENESATALRPIVARAQEMLAARPPPQGLTAELGGLPYIRWYLLSKFLHDQLRIVPVAFLLSVLSLVVSLRWFTGILLPNIAVGTTVVIVIGAMSFYGEPFNIINQIVPTLILIIGIADSIHIVSRYVEEYRICGERIAAAKRTFAAMAEACFLTSFTTAVGFASLYGSKTEILSRFGLLTGLGVMLAYVVTVFLVPPGLSFFVPPRRLLHGARVDQERDSLLEKIAETVVLWSARHAWPVVIATVVACAGLGWAAGQLQTDTMLMEAFDEEDPVHIQSRRLDAEMNGVLPVEVLFRSAQPGRFNDPEVLNAISGLETWLRAQPGVLNTRTYGTLLHEVWAAYANDPAKREAPFRSTAQVAQLASLLEEGDNSALGQFVSEDRTALRLSFPIEDMGSRRLLIMTDTLRGEMATRFAAWPDVTVDLTGDAYAGCRGLTTLIGDLIRSLVGSMVVIFLSLVVTFRSVRLGLISFLPNAFPLLCAAFYMYLNGIYLNTTTAIIFSISLGMAVDNTIHVIARLNEERRDRPAEIVELLQRTARGTGHAVMLTSVMLGLGFSIMLLSSFVPVRLFGELCTIAIGAAVVGDLVVLPAMLRLFFATPVHQQVVEQSGSTEAV